MDKINHIKTSIKNSNKNISKVIKEIHEIPGSTGNKYQHLLNNIVNFNGCKYLEIGVDRGSTLVAALYGNRPDVVYAIDISPLHNKKIESYKSTFNINFNFFCEDCFKLNLEKIKEKINTYHYDGDHSYKSHYKALEYYMPILDDEFIYIVDDWLPVNSPYYTRWRLVQDATYNAIDKLNLEIIGEYKVEEMGRQAYHQGCFIALLKKY